MYQSFTESSEMKAVLVKLTVLVVVAVSVVYSYPQFRMEIPNGMNVPNPCVPNTTWDGVGHKAQGGAGPRNPFGVTFETNGEVWSVKICQTDSDGDGKTNGEELGDPNCTFTKGSTPSRTTGISHPGICEPLGDPKCATMNSWLNCTPPTTTCPEFDQASSKKLELRFPNSSVPAKFTTYICLGFVLPNDTDYHIIGMRPIIDNANILHHGVLYGCDRPVTAEEKKAPFECPMLIRGCRNMILAWTVGLKEVCYPSQYGLLMGPHGVQYALLQLHWSNFGNKAGLMDSSGFQMYYTSQLRPYDGVNLQIMNYDITIPPNTPSLTVRGGCSKRCTNYMGTTKMKIAGAFLHMHLTGRSGKIELIHNGQSQTLITENNYDYNSPRLTFFDQHVDFQAGDEINVTCNFNTTGKNVTTLFGEQTTDEMCLGVLLSYPEIPGFIECANFNGLEVCSLNMSLSYPNCSVQVFQQNLGIAGQVCDQTCSAPCKDTVKNARNTGCLSGEVGRYVRNMWPHDTPEVAPLFQVMDFCAQMIASEGPSGATTQPMSGAASTLRVSGSGTNPTATIAGTTTPRSGSAGSTQSTNRASAISQSQASAQTTKQSLSAVSGTQPNTGQQTTTKGSGAGSSAGSNNGGQSTQSTSGSGTNPPGGSGGPAGPASETGKLTWAIPILVITTVVSVSALILGCLFWSLPPASQRASLSPNSARATRYQ
jgi:dopamine beta-monooxygenase